MQEKGEVNTENPMPKAQAFSLGLPVGLFA
jgi:hypothetical protein